MPASRRGLLAELTCDVLRQSGRLAGLMPAEVNRQQIARLVREMNSYYSNLIEGHRTLPRDIGRALLREYAADPATRDNQHLARTHFEVEEAMLQRLVAEPTLSVHSREFLCWLHREFYQWLPEHLRHRVMHDGKRQRIAPGELRDFEVDVPMQHGSAKQRPAAEALPQYMAQFEESYESADIAATERLVALAAAHHRLAWMHPFGDGTGRVARLQSHAVLVRCGVNSLGLWTLSRGLARQKAAYHEKLAAADPARPHSTDTEAGGNVSDMALADFCEFFLRVMLGEIEFMSSLLRLDAVRERIARSLALDRLHLPSRSRERLARLLRAAVVEGEIPRGRVQEITGLAASTSRSIIQLALGESLMTSASPKGPLHLNFSADNLESWFPGLYLPLEG